MRLSHPNLPIIFATKLDTSIEIDLQHVRIYYNGFDTRVDETLGRIVKQTELSQL